MVYFKVILYLLKIKNTKFKEKRAGRNHIIDFKFSQFPINTLSENSKGLLTNKNLFAKKNQNKYGANIINALFVNHL